MPLPGRVNMLQREFVTKTARMRKTGPSQVEMQAAEPQLKCHKRACEQRTEITHFLCFKGVNVGDVVNFRAIGRFALQFFTTGERCGARKTGIIATNGVGERGAGVLSGSVSVTDIQTLLQRAWCACESDYHSTTGERRGKQEERGGRQLWLHARSRNSYHKAGTGSVAHASLGGSARNAVAAFLCIWSDVWEGVCATQQSE